MKILNRVTLFAIMLTLTIILIPLEANAISVGGEDLDFNNKMSGGKNINYYIAPGNEYTVSIPGAVRRLMYPPGLSNSLVLNKTTSNPASKLDFYQVRGSNIKYVAATSFFYKQSNGVYRGLYISELESLDWGYAEIRINDWYMEDYNNAKRETIILHEMLHAYGLKDIYQQHNYTYVMYGYVDYIPTNGRNMSASENNVIRAKYP